MGRLVSFIITLNTDSPGIREKESTIGDLCKEVTQSAEFSENAAMPFANPHPWTTSDMKYRLPRDLLFLSRTGSRRICTPRNDSWNGRASNGQWAIPRLRTERRKGAKSRSDLLSFLLLPFSFMLCHHRSLHIASLPLHHPGRIASVSSLVKSTLSCYTIGYDDKLVSQRVSDTIWLGDGCSWGDVVRLCLPRVMLLSPDVARGVIRFRTVPSS
jgi:hypothetical protein